MPETKSPQKRLEILDELLQQRWTQTELLEALNDRNTDGRPINKRTLYRDIDFLINEKGAPVHRPVKGDNRYYYTEKFSLKNIPLDEDEIALLKHAIKILKEVDNFELINEVEAIISKLENRLHVTVPDSQAIIQFERHTSAIGQEYVKDILDAIQSKTTLRIDYKPFNQDEAQEHVVHPYLLKEYRNRWFLLGRDELHPVRVSNFALDRVKKIRNSPNEFVENNLFDPDNYFNHLVGVSVPWNAEPQIIELKIYKALAPYVLTKPIHQNQQVLKKFKDGSVSIRLQLYVNYELKALLLSYGEGLEVKKPAELRKQLKDSALEILNRYSGR